MPDVQCFGQRLPPPLHSCLSYVLLNTSSASHYVVVLILQVPDCNRAFHLKVLRNHDSHLQYIQNLHKLIFDPNIQNYRVHDLFGVTFDPIVYTNSCVQPLSLPSWKCLISFSSVMSSEIHTDLVS